MEQIIRYYSLFKIKLAQEEFAAKFTSIVLIAVLIVLYVLFLLPAYKKIQVTRQESYNVNSQLRALNDTLQVYKEAARNYESISIYSDRYDLLKPTDPDPSSFLNKLNYFSLKSNTFLGQTNLIFKENGIEKRSLTLSGDFNGVEEFFKNLNSDSVLYQVETLKLKKKGEEVRSNFTLDLELTINTYYENK